MTWSFAQCAWRSSHDTILRV